MLDQRHQSPTTSVHLEVESNIDTEKKEELKRVLGAGLTEKPHLQRRSLTSTNKEIATVEARFKEVNAKIKEYHGVSNAQAQRIKSLTLEVTANKQKIVVTMGKDTELYLCSDKSSSNDDLKDVKILTPAPLAAVKPRSRSLPPQQTSMYYHLKEAKRTALKIGYM